MSVLVPEDFKPEFNVQKVDYTYGGDSISVWLRSPVLGYEFATTRMDNQVCMTWEVHYVGDSIEVHKNDLLKLIESAIESEMQADDNPNFAITRKP